MGMKPKFGSFVSPCEIVDSKTTSFLEMSKTSLKSVSLLGTVYVDMKDKDVSESVKKLSNIANGIVESSNIKIDDNTASRANTVSDSDMDVINGDTDSLVQDAIVDDETTFISSSGSSDYN